MANVDCTSCDELRTLSPAYAQNGVTTAVCNSLKNNTGLNGRSTDCNDLDVVNDCTVGLMDDQLEAYDTCDWKEFMHKYIPNNHAFNKAMVCAMCGVFDKLDWLTCMINFLMNGVSFRIGEETSGDAYAVAGKGISFLVPTGGWAQSNLSLTYIAGGLVRGTGSYRFYNDSWTEPEECMNFDTEDANHDATPSTNRIGNSMWGYSDENWATPPAGGELICEFRLKKSAFPQLRALFTGFGQEQGGGDYHVLAMIVGEGTYAYGQHGRCLEDGRPPENTNYSYGHLVPAGYIYVQLRMTSCLALGIKAKGSETDPKEYGSQYTPTYFMGIRLNQNGIEC